MKIVTTGYKFADIDGFACCIGYGLLLDLLKEKHQVIISGPVNSSLTKPLIDMNFSYKITYEPNKSDKFIIVDISEFPFFPSFVGIDDIIEVWDHRDGFIDFWEDKEYVKRHIEMIGSCATLIFEEFERNNLSQQIPTNVAHLLYTAISGHTLNFGIKITTDRDKKAAAKLKQIGNINYNWDKQYFLDTNTSVLNDPFMSLKNDTKETEIANQMYHISQLELWDGLYFLENNKEVIKKFFDQIDSYRTFLTIADISRKKNYIVCFHPQTQKVLSDVLKINFTEDVAQLNTMMLRKEIISEMIKYFKSSK